MTPDQERKLDSLLSMVKDHHVILHGPPGNGNNPGMITRLAKATESNERIEQCHLVQAKWFRRQLGAAIAALVAVMYMVIQHFVGAH